MAQAPRIESAPAENEDTERPRAQCEAGRRRFAVIMGSLTLAMLLLFIALWLVVSNILNVVYAGGL